jgi:hypothetical protein
MRRARGAAGLIGTLAIAMFTIAGSLANAASGDVTVPQSALNSLIGEPDQHFHRAFDSYARGDADSAASEVRAGAALIRIEAGRGGAQDEAKLRTTAGDLDTLADNVANGNVGSRRDLELAFAHADLALASHYRSLADKAVSDKDRAGAARWLKAAGDSVDDAMAWTGQAPSGAQALASDQMHALEAKIHAGANWSYDEARRGVGYLGTQIQDLGQQMQTFGNSPSQNASH